MGGMKKNLSIKQSLRKAFANTKSTIMSWNLAKLTKVFVVFALLIGLSGSYVWYSRLYMTNERRFWSAVENSMATQSVTRILTSGGSGNKVVQSQQFFFAPQQATRSHVSYVQKNATVDTAVETEGITFIGEQFSRYTSFRTNQTRDDGTSPNLDDILGKWEVERTQEADLDQARLTYIGDLVTLAIFGNFTADFRNTTIENLKNNDTYRVNADGISEDVFDDQKVIIVPVSIGLKNYVTQLNESFKVAGYGEFPALNPENYREDSRIPASFMINPKNNSVMGIQYGDRDEKYRGYGINMRVEAPEATFEGGQLEALVQQEIQSAL
jgi:hypothetical protein